jgi:hypothetical protein
MIASSIPRGTQRLPGCCICNRPVLLETSKTDEYGKAVHEECYVLKLCSMAAPLNDGASTSGLANRHAIYQPCKTTMSEDWESRRPRQPNLFATMLMQRSKGVPWHKRPWNVGLAAVVTILVLTCWIAFSGRHASSFLESFEPKKTTAMEKHVHLAPAKNRSSFQTLPISVGGARSAALLQEAGLAEQEVIHIGEDVTVRYFTPKPAPHRVPVAQYQVVHRGEDVTVRYFEPVDHNTRD